MDIEGINGSYQKRRGQFKVTYLAALWMVTSIHDLEIELLAIVRKLNLSIFIIFNLRLRQS